MSKKPEGQFIRAVHAFIPKTKVYYMKNNNNYVSGIPDVWYSGRKNDLWVEYKYNDVTKPIALVIPDLSHQQLRWIKDRQHEGRAVWTVVGIKKGGVIYYTPEEMLSGIPPKEFLDRLLTRRELAETIQKYCYGA
jgi:hypothetical protein